MPITIYSDGEGREWSPLTAEQQLANTARRSLRKAGVSDAYLTRLTDREIVARIHHALDPRTGQRLPRD